jgi:hypothetical protein
VNDAEPLFKQKETVDKPGIIGARWWQESIANEVPRRKAIKNLLIFGGALGTVALIGYAVTRKSSPSSLFSSTPEHEFTNKSSLDMQREYGWSFGATGDSLTFDGTSTQPFDRPALSSMARDLAPKNDAHLPYSVPTLFQSPDAMPKSKLTGDPDAPPVKPLKEVLVPIYTPEMATAFAQGKALAAILNASPPVRMKDLAVIVDMPGPQAVAFAAGASDALDPIFLFDNWPHPHGVVPSHLTLAAAAYYQPLFAKAKSKPQPMFVLDRKRLSTYVDDQSQFDNRYAARMPSVSNMVSLGIKNVLYIGPGSFERNELDDLVDDFVAYSSPIRFRTCPATAFTPDSSMVDAGAFIDAGVQDAGSHDGGSRDGGNRDGGAPVPVSTGPVFWYGGSKTANGMFWPDWDTGGTGLPNEVQPYTPRMRATPYSGGSSSTPHRPDNFGMTAVAVALGTGLILGARASRSGSWNRTTYTSSSS